MNRLKKQAGVAAVELAIVAVAFLLLVFGAIEVSRLLFTWNTLDTITQRAARVAAVCPTNHAHIFQASSFGVLPGFTTANLQLQYLDTDFAVIADADLFEYQYIRYVRASIVNYQHQLAIPFINNLITTSPPFTATLPSESLGFIPFDGVRSC